MTINSWGYEGTIHEPDMARWLTYAGGAMYGVRDAADWKVTPLASPARAVQVADGWGHGRSVIDESTEPVTLTHGPVTGGSLRWDMVVAHRSWALNATGFRVIEGTEVRALPARETAWGEGADDQPLALVRIEAGATTPTDVVDLRVWVADGGAYAVDELVLQYLTRPGTRVQIGTSMWSRVIDAQGNPTWVETALPSPLNVVAAGGRLDGTLPTSPHFVVQAGTQTAVTDAAGYARITFPRPFPNGLLSVVLTNGDSSIDRATGDVLQMSVAGNPWGTGRRTDVVYAVMRPRASTPALNAGGVLHRVNWIAIGW